MDYKRFYSVHDRRLDYRFNRPSVDTNSERIGKWIELNLYYFMFSILFDGKIAGRVQMKIIKSIKYSWINKLVIG